MTSDRSLSVKFICKRHTDMELGVNVHLQAGDGPSDGTEEGFWKSSPCGDLEFYVTQEGGASLFELGSAYTVTFTKETVE